MIFGRWVETRFAWKTMIDPSLILNLLQSRDHRKVWPFLLQGFYMTLVLSAIVIPLGLAGGLADRDAAQPRLRWLNWLLIVYVDLFRALPPLVLLIFIYFGAPFLDIDLPKLLAVAIGFLLNTSSYYGEVFRAGIESIPAGQAAAARSTGLSRWQTMRSVILPQATRNVLPDLISNTLEVIKLTTLASVVALPELLNNARQAQALTYNATPDRAGGVDLPGAAVADRAAPEPPGAQEPGCGGDRLSRLRLGARALLQDADRHRDCRLGRVDHGHPQRVFQPVAVARHAGAAHHHDIGAVPLDQRAAHFPHARDKVASSSESATTLRSIGRSAASLCSRPSRRTWRRWRATTRARIEITPKRSPRAAAVR